MREMKNKKNPEIIDWSRDVAKIAGIEVLVLEKHSPLPSIPEFLILLTLLTSLALVSSAAFYIAANPAYSAEMENQAIEPLQAASISSAAELLSEASTTTTTLSATTTTTSLEPTTTTTSTTTTTTTTSTTTTTTTSTTTTTLCGNDGQSPCESATGTYKCKPGNKEGSEGLCHLVKCAPTVLSGNIDGNCGAFALDYCKPTI